MLFLSVSGRSFSQDLFLTKPRLSFEDNQLEISYDIIAGTSEEKYYVWIEVVDDQEKPIRARSLTGDIGENIAAGNNKKIIWTPEKDSVYLDEKIFVQVKAEKLVKAYDKSKMLFKSVVFPGWGQTRISNGKPWWLSSIAVYGFMAGGYLYHRRYQRSYDSYRLEENPVRRTELLKQTQNSLDISTVMIYTSLSAWVSNIIWIALVPERYKPLQHVDLSVDPLFGRLDPGHFISLKFQF